MSAHSMFQSNLPYAVWISDMEIFHSVLLIYAHIWLSSFWTELRCARNAKPAVMVIIFQNQCYQELLILPVKVLSVWVTASSREKLCPNNRSPENENWKIQMIYSLSCYFKPVCCFSLENKRRHSVQLFSIQGLFYY